MNFGGLLALVLTLVIVLLLVGVYLYPDPIQRGIGRCMSGGVSYEPNEHVTTTAEGDILYRRRRDQPAESLAVVFLGGGGFYCNPKHSYGFLNRLHDAIGERFDLLTFIYPTRFNHTVRDSMLAINGILARYKSLYGSTHAVGISFGALLAGTFHQKELSERKAQTLQVPQIGLRFASFSAIGGFFEVDLRSSLLTALFRWAIMRGTPAIEQYGCFGLPETLPKLAFSSRGDFLLAHTLKFAASETCQSKVFESSGLTHSYFQYPNLPEARETIALLAQFLLEQHAAEERRFEVATAALG